MCIPYFVIHPAEKLELSQSSYAELGTLIGSREKRERLVDRLRGILAYRLYQMGSNAFMLGTESIMERVGVFARLYQMGSSTQSPPPARCPSFQPKFPLPLLTTVSLVTEKKNPYIHWTIRTQGVSWISNMSFLSILNLLSLLFVKLSLYHE